jgi:hypothetical protein
LFCFQNGGKNGVKMSFEIGICHEIGKKETSWIRENVNSSEWERLFYIIGNLTWIAERCTTAPFEDCFLFLVWPTNPITFFGFVIRTATKTKKFFLYVIISSFTVFVCFFKFVT